MLKRILNQVFNRSLPSTSTQARPDLRSVMRLLAHPVTIITLNLNQESNHLQSTTQPSHGSTISSLTSISIEPLPLISFSIRFPSRLGHQLLSNSRSTFSVHLLNMTSDSIQIAQTFSKPNTRIEEDTFKNLKLHSFARLDCQVMDSIDLSPTQPRSGSVLFVGEVMDIKLLQPTSTSSPLLYHQQKYTTIK